MAWEDGQVSNVEVLLEAVNSAASANRKRELLNQALGSAKCISDIKKRNNYVALIEDKLRSL